MSKIAIIGGTDLCSLKNLRASKREQRTTPFGLSSAPLTYGAVEGKEVIFIARHGDTYSIPAHRINYQANLWALKEADVSTVIGVSIVGGIRSDMNPGSFVVPDQLIDYTFGRGDTYCDSDEETIQPIDFNEPFTAELRTLILDVCGRQGIDAVDEAVYGVFQGPRLPTVAEVTRMERDGSDIIGLTLMPEACLARELDMQYASLCVVAGRASGRESASISFDDMGKVYRERTDQLHKLLTELIVEL